VGKQRVDTDAATDGALYSSVVRAGPISSMGQCTKSPSEWPLRRGSCLAFIDEIPRSPSGKILRRALMADQRPPDAPRV
jgi:hypothetical protein